MASVLVVIHHPTICKGSLLQELEQLRWQGLAAALNNAARQGIGGLPTGALSEFGLERGY